MILWAVDLIDHAALDQDSAPEQDDFNWNYL